MSIKNSKFQTDSWSEKANLYVNTLQNSDEYKRQANHEYIDKFAIKIT